jgi:excisionase family DNA binding protein
MGLRDKYITISEAAKEVGVTRQTISRWIRAEKVFVEKLGRETLIEKEQLFRIYDEKMLEQFSEAIKRWLRGATWKYLQENHYVTEHSTGAIVDQSRENIRIKAWEEDGSIKVFDIPIEHMEFAIDTKTDGFFRLKKAKVITRREEVKKSK